MTAAQPPRQDRRRLLPAVLRDPAIGLTVLLIWGLLGLFVLYPLGALLSRAFFADGAVSLEPLLAVLSQPNHRVAFVNSLVLATLVGVIGTAMGFLFAFTASRAGLGVWWVRLIDAATLLPLISPPFTTSIAFIFSFGPRGLITHELLGMRATNVYGLTSTLAAEALTYFPIAYLALRPILSAIGSNLEDMAFSLGSSRWRVFRTVTLPLCVPGLANSFLLLFAASLADFATPLILAGNTFPVLPTEAYLQITGMFDLKGGAVLSLVLLVPAVLVFLAQRHWVGRGHYVTVSGKSGPQSAGQGLAPAARWCLVSSCILVGLFILYLYALLFYASVVLAFGANHALTLAHYKVIFTDGMKAIKDTLIIAFIGMPLGGLFGVLVGYLVARADIPGRRWMEVVSMANYALPGTIVGIAYLIAFNDPPLELTGTAMIIVACYVFRYSPAGIRTTVALLQQIDKSIEEASLSLGARSFTTFRRITLPLVLPAFFAGLGVVFIRSMTAISATIFLVSIGWTLITVRILENMTELSLGPAAAFSVFVIVVVLAVTSLINLLLDRMKASLGEAALSGIAAG
jgi:iron(III) transport system permease protein